MKWNTTTTKLVRANLDSILPNDVLIDSATSKLSKIINIDEHAVTILEDNYEYIIYENELQHHYVDTKIKYCFK